MKLWVRFTLLAATVQIVATVFVGIAVLFIVRSSIREMVRRESQETVASIAETVDLVTRDGELGEARFADLREYVLGRSIGPTGFYFVLGPDGRYLVHPKGDVEGKNWLGRHDFIDYIVANREGGPESRFVRYVSPKTG